MRNKKTEMTQYRIAKETGISEQAVGKWFRGICLPTPENMEKLMKVLDMDEDAVLNYLARRLSTWRR